MTQMQIKDERSAVESVMLFSVDMPEGSEAVQGYDFSKGLDYEKLFESYRTAGFQATNFGLAVEQIKKMIQWKGDEGERCKIFLGYTSNMISCGNRDIIRYLVQNKMVDVIVSTAGGIEEDFIKCLAPTYIGDYHLKGETLRKNGLNRIGNLIMPNNNYCKFEEWLNPILDTMVEEQTTKGTRWSPSSMIARLGKEINDERSVYYWAYKNNIPVFSPALTDGSIGDMIYFHGYKNDPLVLDIVQDIRALNNEAVYAKQSGIIILGGGLVKHQICNANLMRNGADYAVFINTGLEYDGSDSGACPDEAVSWGKIKMTAQPVKIHAEASLIFPIIVAETFYKYKRE